MTGIIVNANGLLNFTGAGSANFESVIRDHGATVGTLSVDSGFTLTLSGANTYTGGTIIDGGTLILGNVDALGAGTVSLNSGAFNLGGLALSKDIVAQGGSLSNVAGYTGTVTKSGDGVLSLDATYAAGATINVNAGTLKLAVNSAAGSFGAISIAKGATLDASNINAGIGGDLTLAGGSDRKSVV